MNTDKQLLGFVSMARTDSPENQKRVNEIAIFSTELYHPTSRVSRGKRGGKTKHSGKHFGLELNYKPSHY